MRSVYAQRTYGVHAAYVRRTCGVRAAYARRTCLTTTLCTAYAQSTGKCGVIAAFLRRKCGVRAAQVRCMCGIRAAYVRRACGVRAANFRRRKQKWLTLETVANDIANAQQVRSYVRCTYGATCHFRFANTLWWCHSNPRISGWKYYLIHNTTDNKDTLENIDKGYVSIRTTKYAISE